MSPETLAPKEVTTETTPNIDEYDQLANELATDTNDIVTVREMWQADKAQSALGSVSIKAEGGQPLEVTSIGSQKFSELAQTDPTNLSNAMATTSEGWRTEEK